MSIPTKILILSDTHGMAFDGSNWSMPSAEESIDLVVHCGDLTQESKLEEFQTTVDLLQKIPAARKIIIAGNHEITLDTPVFERHLERANLSSDSPEVLTAYGRSGEASSLLANAGGNIHFLKEGTHRICLDNGAFTTIYASPYTPRKADEAFSELDAGWAYQYGGNKTASRTPAHQFDIEPDTDIVITHGPPQGIMDYVDSKRTGCPDLFAAVARTKPKLHCFGHVHSGWGAKFVAWRDTTSNFPSHFTDIDNNATEVLESLGSLKNGKFDGPADIRSKNMRYNTLKQQGFCSLEPISRKGTLFVNAAIEGSGECPVHPPIMVNIALPRKPA